MCSAAMPSRSAASAREDRLVALAGGLHVERQHGGLAARKQQRRAFQRRAAGVFEHAGKADAAKLAALGRLRACACLKPA